MSWNDLYRLLPVSQDHHPSAPPVYAPGVVRCEGTMQDVGPTDGAEITADRPASQPASQVAGRDSSHSTSVHILVACERVRRQGRSDSSCPHLSPPDAFTAWPSWRDVRGGESLRSLVFERKTKWGSWGDRGGHCVRASSHSVDGRRRERGVHKRRFTQVEVCKPKLHLWR